MNQRKVRNAEIDAIVLDSISQCEGKWIRAIELGKRASLPWRIVAYALKRLQWSHGIETRIIRDYESAKGRTFENRRLYRLRVVADSGLPAWFAPAVPVVTSARVVRGRASLVE